MAGQARSLAWKLAGGLSAPLILIMGSIGFAAPATQSTSQQTVSPEDVEENALRNLEHAKAQALARVRATEEFQAATRDFAEKTRVLDDVKANGTIQERIEATRMASNARDRLATLVARATERDRDVRAARKALDEAHDAVNAAQEERARAFQEKMERESIRDAQRRPDRFRDFEREREERARRDELKRNFERI